MTRFERPLHVGRPNLAPTKAILAKVEAVLESNWLTNDGPMVRELEAKICERSGAKHALCVANGTIALELCYRLFDGKGSVLMPAFTFVATAHAALAAGHTPVFCDIDSNTHCLAASELPSRFAQDVVGLAIVDVWGRDAATAATCRWAQDAGVPVVVDAAHSFPALRHSAGRNVTCCWSFHATKLFNCAEGGAITTDSDEMAERLRLMRNFGFTGLDQVEGWGTNAKMNEISAAIGLANIEWVDIFAHRNRENREAYAESISDSAYFEWSAHQNECASNHHYAVTLLRPEYAALRDRVVKTLWDANVRARRYFWPGVHNMEPYLSTNSGLRLSVTEDIAARIIVLPNGPEVTPQIARQIAQLMENAAETLAGRQVAA